MLIVKEKALTDYYNEIFAAKCREYGIAERYYSSREVANALFDSGNLVYKKRAQNDGKDRLFKMPGGVRVLILKLTKAQYENLLARARKQLNAEGFSPSYFKELVGWLASLHGFCFQPIKEVE